MGRVDLEAVQPFRTCIVLAKLCFTCLGVSAASLYEAKAEIVSCNQRWPQTIRNRNGHKTIRLKQQQTSNVGRLRILCGALRIRTDMMHRQHAAVSHEHIDHIICGQCCCLRLIMWRGALAHTVRMEQQIP